MKITIVLPDGSHQPITLPPHTTLRRLMPTLVAKAGLPRRDESGTAVADYTTYEGTDLPIPDNVYLDEHGVKEGDVLTLHPVPVTDDEETAEPERIEIPPERPTSPPQRPRRQRSGFRRAFQIGCFLFFATFCCLPTLAVTLISVNRRQVEEGQPVETEQPVEQKTPSASTPQTITYADGEIVSWDFQVNDATYNPVTNQLLLVSADPNYLHIYSPDNNSASRIPLDGAPTAVSVSPNGHFIAVGYDQQIAYINLRTTSVEHHFLLPATVADVQLTDDNWIYATASGEGVTAYIYSFSVDEPEIFTEQKLSNDPRTIQLAPDGRSLYATIQGEGFSRLEKFDITQNEASFLYDSGDAVDSCDEVWLSGDGRYAFTGCGDIWRLADQRQNDMVLDENLFDNIEFGGRVETIVHSAAAVRLLMIHETNPNRIYVFEDNSFNFLQIDLLPEGVNGRYLFIDPTGTTYYAIVETDDGEWGLYENQLFPE